jgi:TolB-like protein/tetratricopeptide (TPR) repeat protein
MATGERPSLNPKSRDAVGEQLGRPLDSWKEIASWFNRSEKTVRRWEEREGMPVHRQLHNKRGSVYAYPNELRDWWESRQLHDAIEEEPPDRQPHDPEPELAGTGTASRDGPEIHPAALSGIPETDSEATGELRPGSQPHPPKWRTATNLEATGKTFPYLARLLGPSGWGSVVLGPWSRTRIMATVLALASIVGLLIVGAKLYFARPAKRIGSIAVLPFENLSRNPDQEYFADGMTEELTVDLAKIGGLRVISRTSSMQYKGTKKSLPEIRRELNVDSVLEGSVLRAGDRVRITAQLIRASTDEHLWAETYDRNLKDLLPLQGEVARTIASQIKVTLSPAEQSRLTPPPAVNPKAHEDYLKGLYYLHRNTEGDLRAAIEYFQHATEQDPNYASGFAGLASGYATLSSTYRAPREVMPQAKAAALRALELDQNLAEAHAWLGFVSINFDWDAVTAEKELKRATELNPSYADAHALYAWCLSGMGRHEQAIAEAKRAMQLDPFSRFTYGDTSTVLLMARRYDQALLESQTVVERQPDFGYAHAILGLLYAENGRYTEAVTEAQSATRLDDSPLMLALLAQVHALARNRSEAMKVLQDMEQLAKKRYVCSYEVATAYVLLREKDQAFRWFDKAVEDRSDCMVALAVDPRLDSLRSDPRFQDLQRRVGLPR